MRIGAGGSEGPEDVSEPSDPLSPCVVPTLVESSVPGSALSVCAPSVSLGEDAASEPHAVRRRSDGTSSP